MPTFPKTEAEVVALAQKMIAGLTDDSTDFPAPPVNAAALQTDLDEYLSKSDAAVAAVAASRQATIDKTFSLDALESAMKMDLRYVEMVAQGDGGKLAKVGWSNPAPPTRLQAPGQVRALEIYGQGAGSLTIDWKEPGDGGKPASYKVQRRAQDDENWQDVGVAVETVANLSNQPRKIPLEYRIVAINRVGEGLPSNTITITL